MVVDGPHRGEQRDAAIVQGPPESLGSEGSQAACLSQFTPDVQDEILDRWVSSLGRVRDAGLVLPNHSVEALPLGALEPVLDEARLTPNSRAYGSLRLPALSDGGHDGLTALGIEDGTTPEDLPLQALAAPTRTRSADPLRISDESAQSGARG
jgi:hypothetical protein